MDVSMQKYEALVANTKENLIKTLGDMIADIQTGDLDLSDYAVTRSTASILRRLSGHMESVANRQETLLSRTSKEYRVGEAPPLE